LFLYVDDLLVIARQDCIPYIEKSKTALNNKYAIKDLGEAMSFLNIRIPRNLKAIELWVCQDGNAAVISRPDMSFAASQLSQIATNPSPEHLRYTDRVLLYSQTTKYYAIEFSDSVNIEVETDDDGVLQLSSGVSFADDPETRKSTQDYLMEMFGRPIMWQSSKQKTVIASITEAELLSLSHTVRETMGLYRLFKQIQFDPEQQPDMLCDNQQTVGLIRKKRPQLRSKLKRVDVHNLWLGQIHEDGKVTADWFQNKSMPANGFMMTLPTEKHNHFMKQLDLVNFSSWIDSVYASEEEHPQYRQMSYGVE
jgi:hypothetical protein